MLDSLISVASEVGVLFVLVLAGAICRKAKIITQDSIRDVVELLSVVVAPCLIVHCFQRPFDRALLVGLGWAAAASVFAHVAGAVVAAACIRMADKARESVLRFSVIFSNAGFMALPLEYALFGKEGVFYGAVYVVTFNVVCWSYGIVVMRGGFKDVGWRSILVNPGSVGVALGLPFFLASSTLPPVVGEPVKMLADLNTPLAMLVLGYYLGGVDYRAIGSCARAWLAIGLRLVAMPLVMLAAFWLVRPPDKMVALALVTSASAPAAALTAMLAARYDRDVPMGVGVVAASTLLSILTMPVVVGLAVWAFK